MSSPSLAEIRTWILLLGSGLAALTLAVAGAVVTGLLPGAVFSLSGVDTLVVIGFTMVALSAVCLILNFNWIFGHSDPVLPSPETAPAITQTGAELDRVFSRRVLGRHLSTDEQQHIQDRLRRAAIETIQRGSAVSRSEAEARVDRGTWTADTAAASFLGEATAPPTIRFSERLSAQIAFRQSASRTARAIVTHANQTGPDDDR